MTDPVEKAVDDVSTPIVISPSSIGAQLAAAARIITILVAGFGVLMKLLSAKDLAGAYVWFHTTEGAGFVAAAVAAGTFVYSMYKTWKRHQKMVVLAAVAPDSVAQVKGQ